MAQPSDLQAARESFIQGIMRFDSDNATLARSAAETIANDICRVANKCTKHGVEIAKDELLAGVLVLPSRTSNLKDYLYALSRAYSPRDLKVKIDTSKPGDENIGLGKVVKGKIQQPPQPAFKRLHLLYLMHSVLVHIKDHPDEVEHDWYDRMVKFYAPLYDQLRPIVTTLARLAVCACTGKKVVKTLDTVLHVVSIWQAKYIFSAAKCDEIVRLVKEADNMEWDEMLGVLDAEEARKKAKGTWPDTYDFVVPDRHSNLDNPNAPWHELPAANGLLMKRTRGYPMRFVAFPNGGYALENAGDRAKAGDIIDIKEVYKQIAHARSKWTDPDEVYDIDPLGNIVWQDTDLSTFNQWGMELDRIQWNKDVAGNFAKMDATGYADFPPVLTAGVESAVERAKLLAAGRAGNEMGRGRGRGRPYGTGGGDRGRGRPYGMGGGDRGGDTGYGYGRGGGERRDGERDYANGNGYGGYGRGSGGDRGGYRGRYRGDRRGGYGDRARGYRDRGRW